MCVCRFKAHKPQKEQNESRRESFPHKERSQTFKKHGKKLASWIHFTFHVHLLFHECSCWVGFRVYIRLSFCSCLCSIVHWNSVRGAIFLLTCERKSIFTTLFLFAPFKRTVLAVCRLHSLRIKTICSNYSKSSEC
mgnify:CR=1 FL=1